MRALGGTDARSDLLGCIDRYGEVGFVLRAIVAHHQGQIKLPCSLRSDGHANQAAGLGRKKINNFWRDFFSRDDQVTLIFSILVIHQDDHAAGTDVVEERGDVA